MRHLVVLPLLALGFSLNSCASRQSPPSSGSDQGVAIEQKTPETSVAMPENTPETSATKAKSPAAQIEVDLVQDTDQQITVTYRFAQPVAAFKFQRDYVVYRQRTWASAKKGEFEIVLNRRNLEVVRRKDGQRFNEAQLIVKAPPERLFADYAPIIPFERGGALIYPHQFLVLPVASVDLADRWSPSNGSSPPATALRLASKLYRSAWLDGAVKPLPRQANEIFKGPSIGSYIFLGNLPQGTLTRDAIIADPSIHPWIKAYIQETHPKIVSLMTDEIGFEPRKPAQLFLTRQLGDNSKVDFKAGGDVSEGTSSTVIHLHLKGPDWEQRTPRAIEQLNRIVVHEAIHLWNALPDIDVEDFATIGWFKEGGAEALRARSELVLGLRSQQEYDQLHSESARNCLESYKPPFVLDQMDPGESYRMVYTCGLILGHVTEQLLVGRTYFAFWREFIARAKRDPKAYTTDGYFSLLREWSKNPSLVSAMESFVRKPAAEREPAFRRLLRETGVVIESTPELTLKMPRPRVPRPRN